MRMYDIIAKKRDGKELNSNEIDFVISGFTNGSIPDYQMSAFLMSVYFNSITDCELALFTNAMAQSGDMIDLSKITGIKADKHSTGGVGDKTTLIVAPIVAACDVKVAKMSGRGLGHTGGTIDKLEAIPGFNTTLTQEEFFAQVNKIGISIIGQSGNITPADKKIYALRDVTATVSSIPLIASSIMSKKLAAGSDCILLDVKVGNGAFMKELPQAVQLAQAMIAIGENNKRKTAALITDMGTPLGYTIGNALEVAEAVDVLKGFGPQDLREVSLSLATYMLTLAGKGEIKECEQMAKDALNRGKAFDKLCEMCFAQGADISTLVKTELLPKAKFEKRIYAQVNGYVCAMDTEKCGLAAVMLGAGRENKNSSIDYGAGILLFAKTKDKIRKGDLLATMYADKEDYFKQAEKTLLSAYSFTSTKPQEQCLLLAYVDINGVKYF